MNFTEKYDALCEYSKNSYDDTTIILLGEKISIVSPRPVDELFIDKVKALKLRIESISFSKDRMFLKDIREI